MAKIIELKKYRKGLQFEQQGITFPQLYRVRGYYFDLKDSVMVTSHQRAPACYSFSEEDQSGLTNITSEVISHLDPSVDSGWLIARHHRDQGNFEGYITAVVDIAEDEEAALSVQGFQTKEGLFTLLQRNASPGCPDHLLIYSIKEFDARVGMWAENCRIVHPDGHITKDDGILYSSKE